MYPPFHHPGLTAKYGRRWFHLSHRTVLDFLLLAMFILLLSRTDSVFESAVYELRPLIDGQADQNFDERHEMRPIVCVVIT